MAESIMSRAVGVSKTYVDRHDSLKVDKEAGKGLSTNDYTDDDKIKVTNSIQGIRANGVSITPDSNGTINITSDNIGAASNSHSHSIVTTSVAGFMSASDKSKLDGLSNGTRITYGTGNPSGGSSGDVYFKHS